MLSRVWTINSGVINLFVCACISAIKINTFESLKNRFSRSATKKKERMSKGMATAGCLAVQSPTPKNRDFPSLLWSDCQSMNARVISASISGSLDKKVVISCCVFIGVASNATTTFDVVLRGGFEPPES